MRLGILVRATADLTQTLAFARREFGKTSHLQGHTPAEIHLHPACTLAAAGDVIDGLPVIANPDVPENCLRLTTVNIASEDELAAERAAVGRQVNTEATRWSQAAA